MWGTIYLAFNCVVFTFSMDHHYHIIPALLTVYVNGSDNTSSISNGLKSDPRPYVSTYTARRKGTVEKLEFWTGHVNTRARRTMPDLKYKPKNPRNQDKKHPQLRFKKLKATKVTGKAKNIVPRSSMYRKNETVHKKYGRKFTPNQRSRTHGYKQRDLDESSDFEHNSKSYWPKIQQHRFRKRDKAEERSTRMTPIYLMQQDDEDKTKTTTATEDKKEEDSGGYDLSPYSIKDDMLKLADKFPEANISVEVIGRTAEYNDIVMLKIAEKKSEIGKYFRADDSKYIDEVPEKKIIFIVHGLSIMGLGLVSCLESERAFKELLSYYTSHLDKFDIFLIPMANPDGFSYRTDLWNKNMSPQGACSGVALDRNFDVAWNSSATTSSCSQHYPGPAPFSEPETRAIRDVLHHYSHKIHAYLHVHAGTFSVTSFKGDAVLYPRGYTEVQSDDDKYVDLRGEVDEAMKNASFQIITVAVDTLYNWYGKISGSSVDYAATVYGVPFALELVMQPYEDSAVEGIRYGRLALQEVWRRVIDVVFNCIYRNIKNNEV